MGVPIFKEAGVVPVKVPAKRTAFGDLSNVVRHMDGNAGNAGYKVASAVDGKAGLVSTAPMPAAPPAGFKRDSTAQPAPTAGFQAPAQRPRNSIAPSAPATSTQTNSQAASRQALAAAPVPVSTNVKSAVQPVGKSQAGAAARKANVVSNKEFSFNNAPAVLRPEVAAVVNDFAESAVANWNMPKRSPRHSKSQPCLKNADGLQKQQNKPLRRTLSRLPVDRSTFQDVDLLADAKKIAVETSSVAESEPAVLPNALPTAKEADEHESIISYRDALDIQIMHGSEIGDVHDAPFVDAVEDFHEAVLPSLTDETDEDIGRLREEIEAAVLEADASLPASESQAHYLRPAEPTPAAFMPTVTVASTMAEVEEAWDDDADFYDDQAYTTAHSFRSFGDNTTQALTTVVMPRMTAKIQMELDAARAVVEEAATPEELDEEAWDISMVTEYGDDINNYMRELEVSCITFYEDNKF